MYESMKPIEAGCQALIIEGQPEDIGKNVTVIRYLGDDLDKYEDHDQWEIDCFVLTESGINSFVPEKQTNRDSLMRIDGYDEKESEESKEKELDNVQ